MWPHPKCFIKLRVLLWSPRFQCFVNLPGNWNTRAGRRKKWRHPLACEIVWFSCFPNFVWAELPCGLLCFVQEVFHYFWGEFYLKIGLMLLSSKLYFQIWLYQIFWRVLLPYWALRWHSFWGLLRKLWFWLQYALVFLAIFFWILLSVPGTRWFSLSFVLDFRGFWHLRCKWPSQLHCTRQCLHIVR